MESTHTLSENSKVIQSLATEFSHRMKNFLVGMKDTGAFLGKAVTSYNKLVGSYESRLRPTLQKFEDLNSQSESELPPVAVVDHQTREITQ